MPGLTGSQFTRKTSFQILSLEEGGTPSSSSKLRRVLLFSHSAPSNHPGAWLNLIADTNIAWYFQPFR
ncbi:hypothetical protein BD410DRAFT_781408 [Rickenella mellea]|uniref:Uncharacterized protein n=1 Tax=Rickenella mellea TaxID=50990 RepID=A0A4Y7QMH3_9AGAM|nr:hypothetical protein BD410DRAFT_781408 [Rickenella mellea]